MKDFLSIRRDIQGSVLIQVLVATALITGLGTLINHSIGTIFKNSKRVEGVVDRERATENIAYTLKARQGCFNTFGGQTLANGGNLATITTIYDELNILRYEACGLGCTGTSDSSRVASSRLRFKNISLNSYNKATSLAQLRLTFIDNRNREFVTRRDFFVETDVSDQITRCSSQIAEPLEAICSSLNGALEGTSPSEFCKSLWIKTQLIVRQMIAFLCKL